MLFQKLFAPRSVPAIIIIGFVLHDLFSQTYNLFLLQDKEVSHRINGLLSLSMDQSFLSPSKRKAFSTLKRESREMVARRFMGDNLLCSSKNCSFLRCWFIVFGVFLNLGIIYQARPRRAKVEKRILFSLTYIKFFIICNPNSRAILFYINSPQKASVIITKNA